MVGSMIIAVDQSMEIDKAETIPMKRTIASVSILNSFLD